MKDIVYGNSNFKKIRTQKNYLYIDKTRFIEVLENRSEDFFIFLRPRRFGKSLFLSTLWHYYDERFSNEFESIFKGTYIYDNKTPLQGKFKVLFLSFAGIEVERGLEVTLRGFNNSVKFNLFSYLNHYGYDEKYKKELDKYDEPDALLKKFFEIVENDNIYLLIDEYDHFANALLAYDISDFLRVVGKGGFVRSFYEVLKDKTLSGTIQKMFITGVTPITLDSLSSGFNIVDNISYEKEFNEMAGFTEEEVILSINETIAKKCKIDMPNILLELKKLYNGYLFNLKAKNKIYNSTMLNYFLLKYDTDDCSYPESFLDPNVASDYGIIMRLFSIGNKETNYKILEELIEKGEIKGRLKDRFDLDKGFFEDDFITLIYSMGLITHKNKRLFGEGYKYFEIPNYMMKILYFRYFGVEIEKQTKLSIQNDATKILMELGLGNIEPFKKQLNEVIKILSNRDYAKFNEKHFQSITLALLSFASFYYIQSEKEISNKYPDILVYGRKPYTNDTKNYMFELKWVKNNEDKESKKVEAINQLKKYQNLDEIKEIPNLTSIALIGSKDGVKFVVVKD